MPTLRQKTSFGPGVYRGHKFTSDRLKAFVEGTNKAIAAGIPIPLLKRHAPIGASDEETVQFANSEGAGWIKKLHLESDGSIAWEADNVPESDHQAITAGTVRFTSPEFRDHYVCEKAGVYEGPVIRHIAFTPKPGNPHQGPIETVALEEAGVFQFSEFDLDRPDGSFAATGNYPSHKEDAADNPTHDTNNLANGKGKSVDTETVVNDENKPEDKRADSKQVCSKCGGSMKDGKCEKCGEATGSAPSPTQPTPEDTQHAEKEDVEKLVSQHGYTYQGKGGKGHPHVWEHPDGHELAVAGGKLGDNSFAGYWNHTHGKKAAKREGQDLGALKDYLKEIHQSQHAEKNIDGFNKPENDEPPMAEVGELPPAPVPENPAVNPDMPPVATDSSKLKAVLAGLAQLGLVLPSDYDFFKEGAIDILLSSVNTKIKADNDAEAEAEPEEESPPVQESAMPFSEEELAALPEKVRTAVLAGQRALETEKQARIAAEEQARQFAEQERVTKNNAARDKAVADIEKAKIPPSLRAKLLEGIKPNDKGEALIQFDEGTEQPTFTAQQVAAMVAETLPPSLQFMEAVLADNPAGDDGEPIKQFFEKGAARGAHVSAERAEELLATSPIMRAALTPKVGPMATVADTVAAENAKRPNQVMNNGQHQSRYGL